jgi:predicted metal-dependent hydrolase
MAPFSSNELHYTVRESPKVKYVRLQASVERGLEIIIPKGFDQCQIPAILESKQRWLNRTLPKIQERQQQLATELINPLPSKIVLEAVQEIWTVDYRPTKDLSIRAIANAEKRLVLQGQVANVAACQAGLRQWLANQAHQRLVPWLQQVSQVTQLPFNKVVIRGQRKRWGSCSSQGTINLNYKLLLIPTPLVDYVFIHELCHTVHLNHSAQFWQLVGHHCPNYKQLDQSLDRSSQMLPLWVQQP